MTKQIDLFTTAAPPRLTRAQQLRAEGKTRRAQVDGKSVRFMRLSPRSQVNPIWQTFWTVHYFNKADAQFAAEQWEKFGKITER